MNRTIYKKHTEVYADLKEIIRQNQEKDYFVLPAERVLADLLDTNRMTLAKAMKLAEQDGLIVRENRRNIIIDRRVDLSKCGRILFIASGLHGNIILPPMERIYLKLAADILPLKADLRLFLLPSAFTKNVPDDMFEQLEYEIKNSKIVLFTVKDSFAFFDERGMDILRKYDDGSRLYIKLSSDGMDLCENYIKLDDYKVGYLAAEFLCRGGSTRPALATQPVIFSDENSAVGLLRAGFEDCCEKYKMSIFFLPLYTSEKNPYAYDARAKIWNAVHNENCDGCFLTDDTSSHIAFFDLFANHLVPHAVRVITLNISKQALIHKPPLTAIEYPAGKISDSIREVLVQISEKKSVQIVRKKVAPGIYRNNTVCRDETSWKF